VPGIAQVDAAFAQYAPGAPPTGGNTNGWILGQFFAAAGKNLPDNPTAADVATGLYQIKNNNLQGMTFPITMTPGKPMPKQLCYGVVVIKGGQYSKFPGQALRCKGALPGAGDVQPASDSQPADTAPAVQAAGMEPAWHDSGVGGGRFSMSRPVNADFVARPADENNVPARPADEKNMPARPGADNACGPARAAGWSYFLDAFQTGSAAGPGVLYGIALAVLGTPLPDPFATYQNQFIGQGGTFVEQASKQGPAFFQQMRNNFEPFAVYNDYANTFIETGAKSFDTFADTFGPLIQPGDTSMRQFADSMRDAEVPTQAPCDVVVGSSGNAGVDQLATALAKGDTRKAKLLLAKYHMTGDAAALGEAVFNAGIASANANSYQPFIDAVSHSFVDGGVSPETTAQAFQAAASQAARQGLTMEEGAIGFRTICETYALYFSEGKFS
jgi:hypothetical protein